VTHPPGDAVRSMLACAAEGSIPRARQHQSKLATASDVRAIQASAFFLSSTEAGVWPRQISSASLRSAAHRRCSPVVDREMGWSSVRIIRWCFIAVDRAAAAARQGDERLRFRAARATGAGMSQWVLNL
jgi:hypothetical protein